jgi:hypothetical protein
MRIETLLQRIEAEQTKFANDALSQPAGRDLFAYGQAVGMHAGLEHAKRILIDLVAEKERKDFNL